MQKNLASKSICNPALIDFCFEHNKYLNANITGLRFQWEQLKLTIPIEHRWFTPFMHQLDFTHCNLCLLFIHTHTEIHDDRPCHLYTIRPVSKTKRRRNEHEIPSVTFNMFILNTLNKSENASHMTALCRYLWMKLLAQSWQWKSWWLPRKPRKWSNGISRRWLGLLTDGNPSHSYHHARCTTKDNILPIVISYKNTKIILCLRMCPAFECVHCTVHSHIRVSFQTTSICTTNTTNINFYYAQLGCPAPHQTHRLLSLPLVFIRIHNHNK